MEKEIFKAPLDSRSTCNLSERSRGRTYVETGAFRPHGGESQKVVFDSLGEFDAFTTTSALYPVADMVEQPPAIEYIDADGRKRSKRVDQLYTFAEAQHILRTKSKSEFDQVMLVWKSCLEYAEWPVSLILSGTCELLDLINRDEQLSRRFEPVHFAPMSYAAHGHEVIGVLGAYLDAAKLSRGKTLETSAFARRLLHAARYEFGSKIGLIISAIKLALRNGNQTLEQSHFAGAYRKQKRCVDALNPFIAENFRSIKTGQLLSGAELEIAPAIKRGAA